METKKENKKKSTPPPPPARGGGKIEGLAAETPIIPPGEVVGFSEEALPPLSETPIIPPGNERAEP